MFRTALEVQKGSIKISLQSKLVSIGSCFAQVMGDKLNYNKVKVLNNPFGTTFNPVSLRTLVINALEGTYDLSYVLNNEVWYAYELHSSHSSTQLDLLQTNVQKVFDDTRKALVDADILMITLGSAFVYQHIENKLVVNNCHKMPSSLFTKELLKPEEVIKNLMLLISTLRISNPKVKIIFTVSPVRHTKDTLPFNTISKSTLLLAVYEICRNYDFCEYFPAYELLMDDLRDYRFYDEDLIHPNKLAENYIWQKFSTAYFDSNLLSFTTKWDQLQKSLTHRPFHTKTSSYKNHLLKILNDLTALQTEFDVDVNKELLDLKDRLINS